MDSIYEFGEKANIHSITVILKPDKEMQFLIV
jgi:hypothetical protein